MHGSSSSSNTRCIGVLFLAKKRDHLYWSWRNVPRIEDDERDNNIIITTIQYNIICILHSIHRNGRRWELSFLYSCDFIVYKLGGYTFPIQQTCIFLSHLPISLFPTDNATHSFMRYSLSVSVWSFECCYYYYFFFYNVLLSVRFVFEKFNFGSRLLFMLLLRFKTRIGNVKELFISKGSNCTFVYSMKHMNFWVFFFQDFTTMILNFEFWEHFLCLHRVWILFNNSERKINKLVKRTFMHI